MVEQTKRILFRIMWVEVVDVQKFEHYNSALMLEDIPRENMERFVRCM